MTAWAAWTGLPFGRAPRLLDDPSRLDRLDPDLLRAEAAAAGLTAAPRSAPDRAARLLDHARLLRVHGERVGAPESLARAARQAEAAVAAGLPFEGALEGALAALAAAELAGDGALLDAAAARLSEASPGGDPVREAGKAAAVATLKVRTALHEGDDDDAAEAAAACDDAVGRLARTARRHPLLAAEVAGARASRAELLIGFALRLRDPASAERAAADMADLSCSLDGARLPVLGARIARLRAEALTAAGELTGCARPLADASHLLTATLEASQPRHAPVERARLGRALGHAARALAETCEDGGAADALLEAAGFAFASASTAVAGSGASVLQAQLAFERTAALTARALRPQPPAVAAEARRRAETALRGELIRLDGRREPAAWAAVQVALGRLYAAEPLGARRAEAALAMEEALDVFAEAGLRSLADEAAQALRELRGA